MQKQTHYNEQTEMILLAFDKYNIAWKIRLKYKTCS
jgi:hypothetical protein